MDIVQIFRSEMIECRLHVDADIGICVLIDAQASRGVLQKAVKGTDLDITNLRDSLNNFFRDQVATTSSGRELDSMLEEQHKLAAHEG